MEIFVKEQCINSVHSVAIYLTLFSFSLKVLQPLMATAGGNVSLAHFLLYFQMLGGYAFMVIELTVHVSLKFPAKVSNTCAIIV